VIVDFGDPQLPAGRRIDGVRTRGGIGEINCVTAGDGADGNRRAHAGLRLERPIRAARGRIERVDGAR